MVKLFSPKARYTVAQALEIEEPAAIQSPLSCLGNGESIEC